MSKEIVEEIEKKLLPITKKNSFTGNMEKDLMIGQLLSYTKNLKEEFDKVFDFMIEHDMIEYFEKDAEDKKSDLNSEESE